jgi:hypothetical protein
MRPVRLACVAALALAAVVGVQVALAAPGEEPPAMPSAAERRALQGVNFVVTCRFSHRNTDDLIIFPGAPGRSHDHTYFGNTSTDASSTLTSLRAAETTCHRAGDTAAYWVPTLFRNGEAVEPIGATIYYRRRTVARLRAFPPGLRMIAGDATATRAQPRRVTFWNCGARAGVPASSEPMDCPGTRGSTLRLHVTFPSCWDGEHTDSLDHKSHMAYPSRNACPSSHPVELPAISIIVRYPLHDADGLELASGGVHSAHADFVNAWQQPALRALVARCLNALRHCGRGTDGRL